VSEISHDRVAVIGGGVSGLAAAHYLSLQGHQVDLYEAGDRLGGRIAVDHLDGDEICLGGKNIGSEYSEFRQFLARYGQPSYEYFGINSARLSRDKVLLFNSRNKGRQLATLLRSATIVDLWKLRRALKSVQADRSNGNLSGPYFKALKRKRTKTVSDYFSSKFTTSLARALTVRMNGAEPTEMALEHFGTHLQMLQDEYEQLRSPFSETFRAFKADKNIRTHLGTSVKTLRKMDGFYAVTGAGFMSLYTKVIVAVPAYAAAELVRSEFPKLSQTLCAPRYYPVTVIVAKYKQPVFDAALRALTFPPNSALSNIGAYGIDDLDLVRYTFSGATALALNSHEMEEDRLLSIAEDLASPYFNLRGNACQALIRRSWVKGLCGYTLNEAKFRSALRIGLSENPGLYFTGDYLKGASIENCFRAAKEVVGQCLNTASTLPKLQTFQLASERGSPCPK